EDSAARLVLGRGPAHYEAVLRQARDLDMAIATAAATRRSQIRAAERRQDVLTFVLSVAALLAAAVVGWFGYRMRSLARQAAAREADASRALELAHAAREARERLLRGITHDLKNPLGAADGYAELLQEGIEGELTPGQRKMLDALRRCHADTLATISELLEVARAETGTLEIVNEPCDLGRLIREAAEESRGAATAAGHRFDVVAPGGSLPGVTDPHRVRRVLGNLVSNAIKYTPPPGEIVLEARQAADGEGPADGRWIELRVLDTGPGIPPLERDRIFDEFHRLHGSETRGHGLGLASSRRIARLLGGDITVAGRNGGGSVFSLWLPAGGPGESEGARFRPARHPVVPADRERGYGPAVSASNATSELTPRS
ncbi:MAG: HAMP domain-containing histidine kinase, partial [Gemmatimonadetes bacterium]|nr:HAMP domain-containing histidine kinase [Gemmatimonadota bacterium]